MAKNYFYAGDAFNTSKKILKAYVGAPNDITLINLIPEINGITGWTGGSASTTHMKYEKSNILLTGSTSSSKITTSLNEELYLYANHKYYFRAEVYFSSSSSKRRTSCYCPIAEPPVWDTSSLGLSLDAEQWHLLAMISVRNQANSVWGTGDYGFCINFDNDYSAGQMWIDGVMCIDLTAAYGAGNEPTQGWCNENIPYFVNSLTIPNHMDAVYTSRQITKIYQGNSNNQSELIYQFN